jgi:curved DNA-binding protein CbpA
MFEEDYNPWEILGMEHDNDYDIQNIKRAYKKRALKYHPDKNVGNKDTSDLFNLITNAYIYLLKKAEEVNEHEIKLNRQVSKQDYEDNINENVVNIHLDKDNFNLNNFNKIFEQYKINDENDTGYGNLMKDNDNSSEQKKFNSKVSQDVFNAHFNELKKNKHQDQLIEFQEPSALHSSSGLSTELLGSSSSDGFGFANSNNLSYTDIKSAHFDENLLIDPNSVNYKTYNSVEQLESDRSTVSFKANKKEKEIYKKIEFEENEREKMRQLRVKEKDGLIKNQFKKMNHKLIVHKK